MSRNWDNCRFPDLDSTTAYSKNCRCNRCVAAFIEKKEKKRKLEKESQDWFQLCVENRIKSKNLAFIKKIKPLEERCLEYAIRTRLMAQQRANEMLLLPHLSLTEQYEELEIYKKCYLLTESTGIPHEVDHIIPLSRGGLHQPSNLQILTQEENRKKGNRIL